MKTLFSLTSLTERRKVTICPSQKYCKGQRCILLLKICLYENSNFASISLLICQIQIKIHRGSPRQISLKIRTHARAHTHRVSDVRSDKCLGSTPMLSDELHLRSRHWGTKFIKFSRSSITYSLKLVSVFASIVRVYVQSTSSFSMTRAWRGGEQRWCRRREVEERQQGRRRRWWSLCRDDDESRSSLLREFLEVRRPWLCSSSTVAGVESGREGCCSPIRGCCRRDRRRRRRLVRNCRALLGCWGGAGETIQTCVSFAFFFLLFLVGKGEGEG